MKTGINSIEPWANPRKGLKVVAPYICRKPLLFDPAQSACHQEGGGPLLPPAPGVVSFRPLRHIAREVAHVLGLYHWATAMGLVTHSQCGKRQKKSSQVASRGKGRIVEEIINTPLLSLAQSKSR